MTATLIAGVVAVGLASVTFDPATGAGFVGKGDVQLEYGWNNAQLQANAATVEFRYNSSTETVTTWTCSRTNPAGIEVVTPRNRSVTTSIQGVIDTIARERNQVTGFILSG